jgi:HemX protein
LNGKSVVSDKRQTAFGGRPLEVEEPMGSLMTSGGWYYDTMIYMYALSLLFFFSDFVGTNRSAKRIGAGLLLFVWGLESLYFVLTFPDDASLATVPLFESLLWFAWLLLTVSFVFIRFARIEYLAFFLNVIGFAVLVLNRLGDPSVAVPVGRWASAEDTLLIHIVLAVGSYAALTVSAVLAGMYLILHRLLKERRWSSFMRRSPSLESIEKYTFASSSIGVGTLILSLAAGGASIIAAKEFWALTDPKVIFSVAALTVYIVYVSSRRSGNVAGERLAALNLFGYGIALVNFLFSPWLSSFHYWTPIR